MRAFLLVCFACIAMAAAALLAYPWLEPARFLFGRHGIDVSHHQGPIDWTRIADANVSFAYIKATEGGDFVDKRFQLNWLEAHKAGIARGAYHFFTQCRSGREQAANFIRTVPKHTDALPHAVDAEHMGPCKTLPQIKDVVGELRTFINLVGAHYGKRPLIYTTLEFHHAHLRGKLKAERFWIRSLVTPPRIRQQSWVIWQYHNRGRRPGVSGPVDLNVAREPLPMITK
ncbi:MAG: GH25 family lysozyme [Pseudomonadota bacterium]